MRLQADVQHVIAIVVIAASVVAEHRAAAAEIAIGADRGVVGPVSSHRVLDVRIVAVRRPAAAWVTEVVVILRQDRAGAVVQPEDGIHLRTRVVAVVDVERDRLAGPQRKGVEVDVVLSAVPRPDHAVDRDPRQRRIAHVRAGTDSELRPRNHVRRSQGVVVLALVDDRRRQTDAALRVGDDRVGERHRRIVGAGKRQDQGLDRRAAVAVVDGHGVGLRQRLTRLQRIQRSVGNREIPAHRVAGLVHRAQGKGTQVPRSLRGKACAMRIQCIDVRECDRAIEQVR